ncbi:MAG: HEAT repeat domain-containing protein [bacterium]
MLGDIKEISFQNLNHAAKRHIIKSLKEQGDTYYACYSIAEFLYDEDGLIRELARDSLVQIGNQEVIENVLPLLQGDEATARSLAMEVLKEIAYDNISLLVPLLHDPSESLRMYIADLLGLIGNCKAVDPLLLALQDSSARVRSSAVASLGKLADEKAIETIEKLLQTEKDLWVIFSSIKALESIGGPKATQLLVDLLSREDEFIQAAALDSLGEIGTLETINLIFHNLSSSSESVLKRASTTLIAILEREKRYSLNKGEIASSPS